jgi:DNA-binding NarL/FixJ family response regulator
MRIESEMGQGSRVTLLAPLVSGAAGAPQAEAAATAHGARPPEPAETGPRTKIRVLLADDHILIRQGLCRLLQEHDDVDMVGEAGDGQAALELALRLKPDVVLMDINMPRLNGIAATRRLMEQLPQTKVIGLSVSDEPDLLEAMRDAGAVGFISKGSAIQTLIATIRSSLGGAKAGTALQ